MNYNIATILAVIAILFVLITYITNAPLVPVAVILLGLAIIFGGRGSGSLRNGYKTANFSGNRAERPYSVTLSRDDLLLLMRSGMGTRISFATRPLLHRLVSVHSCPRKVSSDGIW
jgi:hypothetical protein